MTRRSVNNERYRVEQKGSSRKSASSAKPKREAGTAASVKVTPKKAAKSKRWGRGPAGQSSSRLPSTPEMKTLRKWWWILMSVAIVIALAMVPVAKLNIKWLDSVLFGVYAATLGGALYLEFGPLRKARLAAIAAARKDKPGAKKGSKADMSATAPTGTAATSDGEAETLGSKGLKALKGVFGGGSKSPASDNDAAARAAAEASDGKGDAQG